MSRPASCLYPVEMSHNRLVAFFCRAPAFYALTHGRGCRCCGEGCNEPVVTYAYGIRLSWGHAHGTSKAARWAADVLKHGDSDDEHVCAVSPAGAAQVCDAACMI